MLGDKLISWREFGLCQRCWWGFRSAGAWPRDAVWVVTAI